jgi:hypothetical protein
MLLSGTQPINRDYPESGERPGPDPGARRPAAPQALRLRLACRFSQVVAVTPRSRSLYF